jgi:hypothetical protein
VALSVGVLCLTPAAFGRWAHRDPSACVIQVNPHLRYLRNLRMPFVRVIGG